MEKLYDSSDLVNVKLKITSVYTLTGIKYLYRLSDMAYGEWIIYKCAKPHFYFNLFDDDYKIIKEQVGDSIQAYLEGKITSIGKEWSLNQKILGIKSGKTLIKLVNVEKLPTSFLK